MGAQDEMGLTFTSNTLTNLLEPNRSGVRRMINQDC